MIRRSLFLLFVAGVSGTVGVWLGLLFAPAPGVETRASVATFFDEHDETIANYFDRGREALGNAVDAVDAAVAAHDEGSGEAEDEN